MTTSDELTVEKLDLWDSNVRELLRQRQDEVAPMVYLFPDTYFALSAAARRSLATESRGWPGRKYLKRILG